MYSVFGYYNFYLDFYVYRFIYWYGDHSDRVTSDLVSISVIKSIYVLFCTIGGKLMGISESCRPFNNFNYFCIILFGIYYVVFSDFCSKFLILFLLYLIFVISKY